MAKETVKSIAQQLAEGTIDATEAGRKIRGLVTRRAETEAQRTARYQESVHDDGVETDDNAFTHIAALYSFGVITEAQLKAIYAAMAEGKTKLSGALEYYLTEGDPPHPVRRHGGDVAEVFMNSGKWIASTAYDAQTKMTEDLTACTEEEALAAAKKVMGV